MFKIAGELTSTVFHVTARAIAARPLHLGDHSTSWHAVDRLGLLVLQQRPGSHGLCLIAQSSTLRARVPFLHFFDGFRTPMKSRKSSNSPSTKWQPCSTTNSSPNTKPAASTRRPVMRGTAQNPDVYFQGRETVNPYYRLRENRPGRNGQIRQMTAVNTRWSTTSAPKTPSGSSSSWAPAPMSSRTPSKTSSKKVKKSASSRSVSTSVPLDAFIKACKNRQENRRPRPDQRARLSR